MVVAVKMPERLIAQERGANGCKDRELVRLVGRYEAMTIEQLREATGWGRTVTYHRIARCLEGGLIERTAIPGVSSSLLHVTREGMNYARLGLPVARISPARIEHLLRCVSVGIFLERKLGPERLLTEREIVLEEQIQEERIASVLVGIFNNKSRYHRADLVYFAYGGTVAVEVELTPKSPARLRRIIEGWAAKVRKGHLDAVHYLCEPESQTSRAVERAIAKAGAGNAVLLVEMPRR
jgi:hypothetical protein